MDKYENLGLVGEGSYGMVLRCRHKESGQLVAIKKFLESDDDKTVRKIALREIKLLKQLRHDNLVNLIDAFRRKKRVYLVFEFVHHTVLDELEQNPRGLDAEKVRQILWQLCRAIEFCHQHNVIHRDIKPENILISKTGIVKLCDFGFARTCAQQGEPYTDYVATRWYRAPELLVGDTKYGKPIDIWAIGCLVPELATGEPLFPGDSDIDQIYHIVRAFGNLSLRLQDIFRRNKLYAGTKLPSVKVTEPLESRFPQFTPPALDLLKGCLRLNAEDRYTTAQLLKHDYFHHDGFAHKFSQELKVKIDRDIANNPLLREQKRHLMVTSAESGSAESALGKLNADDQQSLHDPTPRVNQFAPAHPNLVPINEMPPSQNSSHSMLTNTQVSNSTTATQSPAQPVSHHLPTVLPLPQQQLLSSTPVGTITQPSTPPPGTNNNNNVSSNNNTPQNMNKKYSEGALTTTNSNNSLKMNSKHSFVAAGKPLKPVGSNTTMSNNSPPSVYATIQPPGAVTGSGMAPITGYGYGGGVNQRSNAAGGYQQLGRTKEQQPGQGVVGMLDALPQLPDVVGTGSTMASRDAAPVGGSRGAAGARRLGQFGGQTQNSSVDIYANSHHLGGKETLPNI